MQDSTKKKIAKAAVITAGVGAACGAAVFSFSNFVYDQIFTAKAMVKRGNPFVLEPAEKERYLKNPNTIHDDRTWFACMEPIEETIQSKRGENLHAEYLKPAVGSHIWCLCIHGWTSCPQNVAIPARHFYEKGWNVLIPHMRGHGKSEQKNVSMGWFDRLDMLDWIDFIISRDPEAQIFLIGVSMGSATVMMTGGEQLPQNVKALIADCGYTSVWDEISCEIKDMFHLPAHPILDIVNLWCRIRLKFSFADVVPSSEVAKTHIPMLFIHGDEDMFVPTWMVNTCYEKARCSKELWITNGVAHAMSITKYADEYTSKCLSFIEKHMKA